MRCRCDKTLKLTYADVEGHCGYQCQSCSAIWLPRKFIDSITHTYHFSYTDFIAKRSLVERDVLQLCPDDGHTLKDYTLFEASFSECGCCSGVWFEKGELHNLLQNYQSKNSNISVLDKLDFLNLLNF